MRCEFCGTEIDNDAEFCPYCGQIVEKKQQLRPKNEHGKINFKLDLKDNKTRAIIIAAVVAVVAIIVIIVAVSSSRVTIKLNNYITINESGYNMSGKASYTFDEDAFIEKYYGKIKLTSEGKNYLSMLAWADIDEAYGVVDYSYYIVEYFRGSLEPSSGLSNGDKITFTWNFDENEITQYYKVKLNYSDIEYTVSNLSPIETFDAFDDISVNFSGVSPNITASIEVKSGSLSAYAFELSQNSGLSAGDEVTVTISESYAESLAEEEGRYPESLSKTYTLDDVAQYVTSLDEIPEDAMKKMKSQAEDHQNAYVTNSWNSDYSRMTSMEFVGNYFLQPKDTSDREGNQIYLIYKIGVKMIGKNEDGSNNTEKFSYYWWCCFNDGIIMPDGTFSIDYSDYTYPESVYGGNWGIGKTVYDYTKASWYRDVNLTYYGAEDLDTLFNKIVTANIEDYTYETNISTE